MCIRVYLFVYRRICSNLFICLLHTCRDTCVCKLASAGCSRKPHESGHGLVRCGIQGNSCRSRWSRKIRKIRGKGLHIRMKTGGILYGMPGVSSGLFASSFSWQLPRASTAPKMMAFIPKQRVRRPQDFGYLGGPGECLQDLHRTSASLFREIP